MPSNVATGAVFIAETAPIQMNSLNRPTHHLPTMESPMSLIATFDTARGPIKVELYPDKAPLTVPISSTWPSVASTTSSTSTASSLIS